MLFVIINLFEFMFRHKAETFNFRTSRDTEIQRLREARGPIRRKSEEKTESLSETTATAALVLKESTS